MTQIQPSDSRRILSLPAVNPCPAISPATLLGALTALASEIHAYRSESFPVHRRIVREALREVGAVLAFLEDIRDRGARLPDSLVLSFSDLHVTLQRLRHLVADCARRGARLWILMNADRVSSELRVLIRAVATALDVVPLSDIDADEEAKDVVRLVARQAWKVRIRTDLADDLVARAVRSALDQFENGVAPDSGDLEWILDHLEIRNWADCGEEIAFLEEEKFAAGDAAAASGRRDKGEASLLGSLMALMVYCRAALFDVAGADATKSRSCRARKQESRFRELGLHRINPEDLRCPISLELMTDPVTISTGQTYDLASIARWLQDGNLSCPVTGEKLSSTDLVPNSAVQRLVQLHCHHRSIPIAEPSSSTRKRDVTKTSSPGSPAAAGATRMAAAILVDKLSNGTEEEKNRAAFEIRLLSKSNLFHRSCLVKADAVPWLLRLLSSSDPLAQDNAAAALLNLSKHPRGRTAIFEVGGLGLVVGVIREGLKVEAQQNAAAILFYLSSVDEYRQEIGEIPGAIPALVDLLKTGSYRGRKNAVVTLFGLLLLARNHSRVISAGAIPALTDLLSEEREDLVNDCVGVLAKIAERKEGSSAILRSSSAVVPSLVALLQSSASRSGREYCVSVLLSLCNNGGPTVIAILEKMPPLMPSLYSLLTGGSPQACKKARSLLNHIHQFHDQGYPAAAIAPPARDHIVHAL